MLTDDFSKAVAIGAQVPNFSLPATTGQQVTLSVLSGPAVVFFTCNHCPYVVGWEGRLQELARTYGQSLHFVGINANDASRYPDDTWEKMVQRAQKGLPYLYVHDADQQVAKAWGAQVTPEFFVIDADHRLAYHGRLDGSHQDPRQAGEPTLRNAIESVLLGQQPQVATSPVHGCSVKWFL